MQPQNLMYLWCVAGTVLLLCWNVSLQYLQFSIAESGNRSSINVAQYSVMLSNCGRVQCDDRRLEDFGKQYGDVVGVFYVRRFGTFLHKNTEVGRPHRSVTAVAPFITRH